MSVQRVLARFRQAVENPVAMEFTSPEAMQKYLKDHPGADPKNHSVKKPDESGEGESHNTSDGGEPGTKIPVKTDSDAARVLEDSTWLGNPKNPNHGVIELLKSGKPLSKQQLRSTMDALSDEMEKLEGKVSDEALEATEDVISHLSKKWNEAVQKSPEYKTERAPDYYPQKKPKGYQDAEGAAKIMSTLNDEEKALVAKLPDEDIDKNEAYEHPRIKAITKALVTKVKSGEMTTEDLTKRQGELMKLRSEMMDGSHKAKSDEENDGWRFPGRQLYKLWQGYNEAITQAFQVEEKKKTKEREKSYRYRGR